MNAASGPADLLVLGRFPPPIDGQSKATERTATLLERDFNVWRVNQQAAIRSNSIGRLLAASRCGAEARRALESNPSAQVVWTTISPTVLGHMRDLATVLPAVRRSRIHAVVHWGNFDTLFQRRLLSTARTLVDRVTSFVFLAEGLADACAPWIPASKRVTIPNTIDAALIPSSRDVEVSIVRRAASSSLRLLYVGNMVPAKGYMDVVEAVARLRRKGTDARLDCAGGWFDNSTRAEFFRRLAHLGLLGVVNHHGLVAAAQLGQLYRQSHYLCLPSKYAAEAQPLVILEAFASGTPVVATNHGGIASMVNSGENGMLLNGTGAVAVEEVLEVQQGSSQWQRMALNANATFHNRYSPSRVRKLWQALLR